MPRRLRYADAATAGRFPLQPGKPLVHRRSNGAWGFTCYCVGHHRPDLRAKSVMQARYNCPNWQEAFREAVQHVAWCHKTAEQYEIEALEAAYALPTAGRTRP
ncbi:MULTISPECIES: hypothetical protein [unclassified Streptomyces]|uniref:hypothetical protein n=1 Tax=unclassified Streptomyces TaxID=2593676 RepID=UPI001F40B216|nr:MULTISPECIES: hypothetical protein [unclassified Streptomyces]MCF0086683.1 hypothetical protein [Streptomyces sp. MH192]MCF0098837.1 hypothetical protein [Streptomyces sp. MH191]